MWYLFIPYLYGFNSRAKTLVHRLSFLAIIFIPIYIKAAFLGTIEYSFCVMLIGFTAMYSVYEVGYIFNDVYTISKEEKPTKWLSPPIDCYVKDKFPLLISTRIIWVMVCIFILNKLQVDNIIGFVICLCLTNLVFSMHNYYRGKENVFTNGGLQFFKYISVLLLFGSGANLILHSCFIYLEIAFERTLEYAIVKRYYFLKLQKINIDNLRIVYYVVLSAVALVLVIYNKDCMSFFAGSFYLLLYRISCKLLTLSKRVIETRSEQ